MVTDMQRLLTIAPENRGKVETISVFLYERAGIEISPAIIKFALMSNNLQIQINGLRKG